MRLTFLDASQGTFETIGPSTLGKWRLHFEKPAQNHTTTISSFAATIMSTNGKNAMKISAGRYCSERAAMNNTLSRKPRVTSRTITATIAAGATRPWFEPSARSIPCV